MGLKVLVLGGSSAIAEQVCRLYAKDGAEFLLAGRDEPHLREIAADLRVRGAEKVEIYILDLLTSAQDTNAFAAMDQRLGGADVVLLAYGVLGDQLEAEADLEKARAIMEANFVSAALWALAAATSLESRQDGALVVLGSVAGDRGRRSNYIYGAAKAGLAVVMQGLAHRFAGTNVRIVLVKLGMVDTPMTRHMPKRGMLWASPQAVARHVVVAASARRTVVYAPSFWRPIMLAIRALPTAIFHKLRL